MEELFGFGLLAFILSPEILSFLGIVFVLFALYFLFIEFSLFILLIGLPLISILCYFFYRKHKNKNIDIKDDKIEGNKHKNFSILLKILSLSSLSLWFVLILSIIISGVYINKNPIIINENVLNKIDLNIKKEKDLPLIKLDYNLNETKVEFSPIGYENKIVVFSQINGNLKGDEKIKTLINHLPLKLIKNNNKENIKLEKSFNVKIKLAAIPYKRNNGIYLNNIDIISIDFDSNELTNKEKEIIIYGIILPTFETFINLSLVDKPIYQFNKWYEKIIRFFIDEIIVQNQSIYIKTIFN